MYINASVQSVGCNTATTLWGSPLTQPISSSLKIKLAAQRRHLPSLWIFAAFLLATSLQAQSPPVLPSPVPQPRPVETPRDVPYPGTIKLHVDATDVLRRIYQIQEIIPVSTPGTQTLLFPEWTPGDHAPNAPLEKLAGLVISAGGTRIHWQRDTVNVHAFSFRVPPGVTSVDVRYQYLGSNDATTGPVLITPTMLDLQWQSLVLYPAGHFARDITYQASVTLPAEWTYLTSIDGGHTNGSIVSFPPMALDALVDQPVMAGRYLRQITLTDDPVPVRLDVAAQDPADLTALPEAAKKFTALMPQAYKLFGSHHYDHYDHMIFLSDELSTYFEHHRSGENVFPSGYFKVVPKSPAEIPAIYYIAHGYMHSWNGMYRRPAEMWTPNLNTPERDSLLWVFEGLTDYWADVLSARAGLLTKDDILENFADLAAGMTLDAGADWRPLEDTNNDPVIIARRPTSWGSWQRSMFDPYTAGEMIWLETDTIIRQQSGNRKSLDDFAKSFFSGNDVGNTTNTYTFDDMVAALNAVQPYDWHSFFRSRLDDYGQGRLVHSIDRAGYKLVFTDKASGGGPPSKSLDLAYSLGMRVNATGRIYAVHWDGPAFKANLTIGETIVSVNGKPYNPELLTAAVVSAATGGPLDFVVKRGGWQQATSIEWRGGLRYPHLERIEGETHLLDEILNNRPEVR